MTLGIFDSGEGGYNLLRHARLRNNRDDVIFLCDRANSPYGTKREYELRHIVEENIATLKRMGAEKIIIACCTACTVYRDLADTEEVYPILGLAARVAERVSKREVAVIATGATVRSGEFARQINGRRVRQIEAQPLVSMIDGGVRDGDMPREASEYLDRLVTRAEGADTLVLGCTHFSSVKEYLRRVGRRHGIERIVDAAAVGATLAERAITDEGDGTDYVFITKRRA